MNRINAKSRREHYEERERQKKAAISLSPALNDWLKKEIP